MKQEDEYELVGTIQSRFEEAETGRLPDEQRWLQAYKNYRGIYDSSTQYRENERSQVFIKITKTKVLAAYGQIVDILFSQNKFPISVESTPVPEGIVEFAHLSKNPQQEEQPQEAQDPLGFPGDGRELLPGATEATVPLGGMADQYEGANLSEGPSRAGEPQVAPARESARFLEKCIQDQLLDTNAVTVMRHALFECTLLGTGIIKGPFNYNKTVHNWSFDKESKEKAYSPYEKSVPRIESVSCWDFYPDPSATSTQDCEYAIQRHRFNREQLYDLLNRPLFDKKAIESVLEEGPNYEERYFESTLYNNEKDTQNETGLYKRNSEPL